MSAPRKPTSVVLPAVAALVLLGSYVGAYYWSVIPVNANAERIGPPIMMPVYVHGDYRFFTPIHWLDRRIRLHIWEPTP